MPNTVGIAPLNRNDTARIDWPSNETFIEMDE